MTEKIQYYSLTILLIGLISLQAHQYQRLKNNVTTLNTTHTSLVKQSINRRPINTDKKITAFFEHIKHTHNTPLIIKKISAEKLNVTIDIPLSKQSNIYKELMSASLLITELKSIRKPPFETLILEIKTKK